MAAMTVAAAALAHLFLGHSSISAGGCDAADMAERMVYIRPNAIEDLLPSAKDFIVELLVRWGDGGSECYQRHQSVRCSPYGDDTFLNAEGQVLRFEKSIAVQHSFLRLDQPWTLAPPEGEFRVPRSARYSLILRLFYCPHDEYVRRILLKQEDTHGDGDDDASPEEINSIDGPRAFPTASVGDLTVKGLLVAHYALSQDNCEFRGIPTPLVGASYGNDTRRRFTREITTAETGRYMRENKASLKEVITAGMPMMILTARRDTGGLDAQSPLVRGLASFTDLPPHYHIDDVKLCVPTRGIRDALFSIAEQIRLSEYRPAIDADRALRNLRISEKNKTAAKKAQRGNMHARRIHV